MSSGDKFVFKAEDTETKLVAQLVGAFQFRVKVRVIDFHVHRQRQIQFTRRSAVSVPLDAEETINLFHIWSLQ